MEASSLAESLSARARKREFVFYGLLILVFAFIPVFLRNQFYLNILIMIFFWAAMAGCWNIFSLTGYISFGHQAFFGIGAYTSSILFLMSGYSPWIGMLIGFVFSACFATILGLLCSRLRGLFFALATMAFGELFMIMAVFMRNLTKGSEGIWIPFKPGFENMIFRGKGIYFYLFLGLMVCVLLVSLAIERSKLGYYLWAIRQDQDAARSLGIRLKIVKLIAINISAIFTAICGTMYAQYFLFIDPYSVFTWHLPVQMALITLIGGMGSAFGPMLGSFFITPIAEGLRAWLGSSYSGLDLIIYGPILIWAVLFLPQGLWSKVRKIFK